MIQAFLDGETSSALTAQITQHIALCDACAVRLADADEENSIVFSALDREFNSLVPTQRLWTRINDTISVEKSRLSPWQRFMAAFPLLQLSSPTFAAIGGVVMLVSIFAVVNGVRNRSNEEIANIPQPAAEQIVPPSALQPQPVVPDVVRDVVVASASNPDRTKLAPMQVAAKDSVKESRIPAEKIGSVINANYTQPKRDDVRDARTLEAAYLPGEESYIKTISDLKESVDGQKDRMLAPSSRIAFERDMAIVNDSIKRMKTVVRKNPRNQAAKQVLYSAYQDKIDLLNSVAQREELMVSLR
jgi:hypothetical protein